MVAKSVEHFGALFRAYRSGELIACTLSGPVDTPGELSLALSDFQEMHPGCVYVSAWPLDGDACELLSKRGVI